VLLRSIHIQRLPAPKLLIRTFLQSSFAKVLGIAPSDVRLRRAD
jgi:hypothetical protein